MDEQTPQYTQTPSRNQSWTIPAAIVFGFALIAGAIFLSGSPFGNTQQKASDDTQGAQQEVKEINPVTADDHILGNPNAPITIVEYSDFDCPFCKVFHETMQLVMDNYGTDGSVAWVYRHFPLEQRHPNAPYIAAASECVSQLGGNEAFWAFSDKVFGERDANELTDVTRLGEFATAAGVSETDFQSCINSGAGRSGVETDFTDGAMSGVSGTPYSFVQFGDETVVINGAQKYEYVSKLIDTILSQMEE